MRLLFTVRKMKDRSSYLFITTKFLQFLRSIGTTIQRNWRKTTIYTPNALLKNTSTITLHLSNLNWKREEKKKSICYYVCEKYYSFPFVQGIHIPCWRFQWDKDCRRIRREEKTSEFFVVVFTPHKEKTAETRRKSATRDATSQQGWI